MTIMVQREIFVLLVVVLYATSAQAVNYDNEWENFKITYGKNYSKVQEKNARLNFENNLKLIKEHNENPSNALTFHLKMNQFGDLNPTQYKKLITDKTVLQLFTKRDHQTQNDISDENIGKKCESIDIDLRKNGYVTAVKDQGLGATANASWAFSVIGALEGQVFQNKCVEDKVPKQNLSVEYLIRCAKTEIKNKVEAETHVRNVLKKYVKEHGIFTEKLYSYINTSLECSMTDKVAASISFHEITDRQTNNADSIKRKLCKNQPVLAYVDVSSRNFQFYHNGTYTKPFSKPVNHIVLIIGHGTDKNGDKYWLVKNSWGTSWGEEGYMKISQKINITAILVTTKTKCCYDFPQK